MGCRFYENEFPEVDDVVMVRVVEINETYVNVELLEYNKIVGMINLGEMSRRHVRNISRLTAIGKDECAVVTRVDSTRGYLDLSRRRVLDSEIDACTTRYLRGRTIQSMLGQVVAHTGTHLNDLYRRTVWVLQRQNENVGDVFASVARDETCGAFDALVMSDHEREILVRQIRKHFAPRLSSIHALFKVECPFGGVAFIKTAIAAATDPQVRITLVGSPVFLAQMTTTNPAEGIQIVAAVLERIAHAVAEREDGMFTVAAAPHVVNNEDEEKRLQSKFTQQEDQDVSGDDNSSDSDN